jgi:hypothetical protein
MASLPVYVTQAEQDAGFLHEVHFRQEKASRVREAFSSEVSRRFLAFSAAYRVTASITHFIAVESAAAGMACRMAATSWERPVVSMMRIEPIVHMTMEARWSVEPRSRTDKDST